MLVENQNQKTVEFFTLVYMDRTESFRATNAINGVTVHKTIRDAYDVLAKYIKGVIVNDLFDAFQEDFMNDLNTNEVEDNQVFISNFLGKLDIVGLKEVCEWTFERLNEQDDREAFYQINPHMIEV